MSSSWVLVPCLVALREEFNRLAPGRDKGADGSIGDDAHQQESSDHNPDETGRTPYEDADSVNEVHAIDIDSTGPWPAGRDLDSRVEIIRLRHLHGQDDRLQNIIWRDRVASRSWGWTWDPRPGIGHYDHAHFSARYTTAQESDISPWGVWEDDMALDTNDAKTVWNADIIKAPDGSKEPDGSVNENWSAASYLYWGYRAAIQTRDAANAALAAVKDIARRPDVDEVALAAALTGPVVAGIVAALPPGDQVSQDEVTVAVASAFAQAFGQPTPSAG